METPKENKKKPNFASIFFWEFDMDAIDFERSYKTVIPKIVERGGQEEIDELVRFYGREKIIKALSDEIYFLPNYGIDSALEFFPELKKEEMYCYLNRKDKPYHWI